MLITQMHVNKKSTRFYLYYKLIENYLWEMYKWNWNK